jgi:hypothetical protein
VDFKQESHRRSEANEEMEGPFCSRSGEGERSVTVVSRRKDVGKFYRAERSAERHGPALDFSWFPLAASSSLDPSAN